MKCGYKNRSAHINAFRDLRANQLQVPEEIDYCLAKKSAKDALYSCNGMENEHCGWGKHTEERIDEAWATLEAETTSIPAPPPAGCGGYQAIQTQQLSL